MIISAALYLTLRTQQVDGPYSTAALLLSLEIVFYTRCIQPAIVQKIVTLSMPGLSLVRPAPRPLLSKQQPDY
jgi:hypothetical protein